MDGEGPSRDNVFLERVWARSSTKRSTCMPTVLGQRRQTVHRQLPRLLQLHHSSLKAHTPDQVYFNRLPESVAA